MTEKTEIELRLEAEIEQLRGQYADMRKEHERLQLAVKVDIEGKRRELRNEWNRKASEEKDILIAALEARHGIKRDNPKFQKAWAIAWDRGHSGGYAEVESCFDEMAELLK